MSDEVPNLRGGIPKWIAWLFGVALSVGMFIAPAIVTLIKDSSKVERMDLVANEVAKVVTKIAVMEALQAKKDNADEKFQQRTEEALRELTARKK